MLPIAEEQAETPQTAATAHEGSRSERTRARLLDAAEEVFGELGYHAASIGEITSRAGVGLGTFYLYFPSKIEIYRHLLRARQQDFIRTARRATEGSQDQAAIVQASFRAFFDWMAERPAMMRVLREAEFIDPSVLDPLYLAPARELSERLRRAMERGHIARVDPDVLAWCLMGMAEFTVLRWIVWEGGDRVDADRYDAFTTVVMRALGVQSPD